VAALALLVVACAGGDNKVREDVLARLTADPATAPLRLEVSVTNGVVHLAGETRTKAQQDRAVQLARSAQGIKGVVSDLKIDDRVILENVRGALAADPPIANVPVTIHSKDGEVTLTSSQTNAEQRARMVHIASTVEGVTHVVDDMK
jgi:osmotically-inducible protein OsmY